jgi:hypothetical protein
MTCAVTITAVGRIPSENLLMSSVERVFVLAI